MTSLRYFKDETPEYDPYKPGNVDVFDSMESTDSPIRKRVTLVNKFDARNQVRSARSEFNDLFNELDEDLLDSIDEYLYSSSLKRGRSLALDEGDESSNRSLLKGRGEREIRPPIVQSTGFSTSKFSATSTTSGTNNNLSSTRSGNNDSSPIGKDNSTSGNSIIDRSKIATSGVRNNNYVSGFKISNTSSTNSSSVPSKVEINRGLSAKDVPSPPRRSWYTKYSDTLRASSGRKLSFKSRWDVFKKDEVIDLIDKTPPKLNTKIDTTSINTIESSDGVKYDGFKEGGEVSPDAKTGNTLDNNVSRVSSVVSSTHVKKGGTDIVTSNTVIESTTIDGNVIKVTVDKSGTVEPTKVNGNKDEFKAKYDVTNGRSVSINYEEDIPIRKSKRKIIYDSQRYTADSGISKDELDNLVINESISDNVNIGSRVDGNNSTISKYSQYNKNVANSKVSNINMETPTNKLTITTSNSVNDINRSNGGIRTNLSGSFDSDSSEEEEDFDECIICSESMKSELKNEIGVLDVCSHVFCFKCIKTWSDRANSCPLCKREFIYIRKVNLYNIQDLIEKYCSLTNNINNTTSGNSIGKSITIGSIGVTSNVISVEATVNENKVIDVDTTAIASTITGSVSTAGYGTSISGKAVENNVNNKSNNGNGSVVASTERPEAKSWRERRLRCIRKNKISKLKKIINEKKNWFELIPSVKVKVERKKLQENEDDEGCAICGNDDNWSQLLLCDNCDKGYHTYCLDPPLTAIPENNWYCAQCIYVAGSFNGSATCRSGTSGSVRESRRNSTSNTDRVATTNVDEITRSDGHSNGTRDGRNYSRSNDGGSNRNRTSNFNAVGINTDNFSLRNEDYYGSNSRSANMVSRILGNAAARDSIITISSTTTSPTRTGLTSGITTSRTSRRGSDAVSAEEEELKTSLLSQVYKGLNKRSPNATNRALSAIRSSIDDRLNKIKANSTTSYGVNNVNVSGGSKGSKRRNNAGGSTSTSSVTSKSSKSASKSANKKNTKIEGGKNRSKMEKVSSKSKSKSTSTSAGISGTNIGGGATSLNDNMSKINFIDGGIKTSSFYNANRFSNKAFNNDEFDIFGAVRVYSSTSNTVGISRRNSGSNTPNASCVATNRTSIGGGNREYCVNNKNIDQLILESLESIDNYLLFNTTKASNRKTNIPSTANTTATVSSFPSNSASATGFNSTATLTTNSMNIDPNNMSRSSSINSKNGQVFDGLTKRDIDLLLSDATSSTNTGSTKNSGSTAGENTERDGGASTRNKSNSRGKKDKKYTSFIYRYKTLKNEEYGNSTSYNSKQDPHISGKTVKYLF